MSMKLRELKALEIAARAKITFADGFWLVPSQTASGVKYHVTIGAAPTCECDDFALRKLPCKHIMAARVVCERDHNGKAPAIVVDRPRNRQAAITFFIAVFPLCCPISIPQFRLGLPCCAGDDHPSRGRHKTIFHR